MSDKIEFVSTQMIPYITYAPDAYSLRPERGRADCYWCHKHHLQHESEDWPTISEIQRGE